VAHSDPGTEFNPVYIQQATHENTRKQPQTWNKKAREQENKRTREQENKRTREQEHKSTDE